MDINKKAKLSYIFEMIMIASGLLFNYLKIGMEGLFEFSTVGNYLIYIGFIGLAITTIQTITKKKKKIDERMIQIAYRSTRISFVIMIFAAFIIMVADGIKTITLPYSMFMSYFVMFMVLSNLIVYKIMLKYN